LKQTHKTAPAAKTYRWTIYRLRATPAAPIGSVDAPDADKAIQRAIKEFDIRDPHQQKRLIAQRQA
jgi:hypothetical protein